MSREFRPAPIRRRFSATFKWSSASRHLPRFNSRFRPQRQRFASMPPPPNRPPFVIALYVYDVRTQIFATGAQFVAQFGKKFIRFRLDRLGVFILCVFRILLNLVSENEHCFVVVYDIFIIVSDMGRSADIVRRRTFSVVCQMHLLSLDGVQKRKLFHLEA